MIYYDILLYIMICHGMSCCLMISHDKLVLFTIALYCSRSNESEDKGTDSSASGVKRQRIDHDPHKHTMFPWQRGGWTVKVMPEPSIMQ